MSREKPMILRVESSEGVKRVEVQPSASLSLLYEVVKEVFELASYAFALFRERNKKNELASSKSRTVASVGLRHGDMVFLSPVDGAALFRQQSGSSVEEAGPSTITAPIKVATLQKIQEDDVDLVLYKEDGKVQRLKDEKLCRHNSNSKCVHCSPLEPFDEGYLKEHNVKHLSFHSYLRKMMSGVDRGKFLALEDVSCRIKNGCKDHPPWPKGICSKCQPNAITLNQQPYRHVDNVAFENTDLVERFLNYWRCTGHQRVGFLYGTYEVHSDVPLGIRANVVAIYEPPQESSRDTIKLLPDDRETIVDHLALALGLRRVGWIFTDLLAEDVQKGTVKHTRNIESHFLSAQECIMSGHFQNLHPNPSKFASTGKFGSKFVTVCVTGDKTNQVHMEGYQVSNQCMALVRDKCLLPTKDAPELGYVRESSDKQYVPDVYYKEKDSYGNEVSRLARPLPVEYLLLDVPASTPVNPQHTFNSDPSKTPFPVENRMVDGHIQDFNALSTYLSQFSFNEYLTAFNDFHLLLYIATMEMLPMKEYMGPLLEALRAQDASGAESWSRSEHWATVEQLIAASSPPPSRPGSVTSGNISGGSGAGGGGGSGSSPSGPKWACPHCTFLNNSDHQFCEMCEMPRIIQN